MKKNILITGASGNLGKATVEKFLETGQRVIANVTPGKSLPFQAQGEIVTFECDLINESATATAINDVLQKHGSIDVAVLLVGGFTFGGIQVADGASVRKMFQLNFETAYYVARPVFLAMQKQAAGGRIVLIGARPALQASDGKSKLAYSLSKSLIFKLAELLNSEGAQSNVVTSVIVPSTIDTPVNRKEMPDADFSKWVKPEEIASVIEFITGEQGTVLRDPVIKVYGKA